MAYIIKIFLFTSAYGYLSFVTYCFIKEGLKENNPYHDIDLDKEIIRRIVVDVEMDRSETTVLILTYLENFKDCPNHTELDIIQKTKPTFNLFYYLDLLSQFFS